MAKADALHADEANALYWSNEASVGEIANRLGISRRSLYELLEPRPADIPCPKCGTETVFVNRSALTAGIARCPACETETAVPAVRTDRNSEAVAVTVSAATRAPRHVALGSVALVGVVIGAVAALILTQRD